MRKRTSIRGFTAVELIVVVVVLGILLALAIVYVNRTRQHERPSRCGFNLHNLIIATKTYETAKHRYPSSAQINAKSPAAGETPLFNQQQLGTAKAPGSISAGDAGYSWLVQLLPFLDEAVLYEKIAKVSENLKVESAFSAKMVDTFKLPGDSVTQTRHFSTISLSFLICTSFSGENYVPKDGTISKYDQLAGEDSSGKPYSAAITNYVPLVATHLECMKPKPDADRAEPPNGMIIPGHGLSRVNNSDGESKTIMLTETKEQYFSSWYDGTTPWTVAVWPDGKNQPTKDAKTGWWTIDTTGRDANGAANGAASLAAGPKNAKVTASYMTAKTLAGVLTNYKGQTDWKWGPSSDHESGNVMHAFADGGVRAITQDIDPNVYMHLVTRAGGENDGGDVINN